MTSLPKTNDDGKGLVSYSQMRLYKSCPKAYEYRYLQGLRDVLPGRVKIGSAFDKAANELSRRQRDDQPIDADAGLGAAMDYLADPGEEFDETDIAGDDTINDRISQAVTEYASLIENIEVVDVQYEIEYALTDDVLLIGNVDVVEFSPEADTHIVTDNKTTLKKRSGKYTHDTATSDEQLTLYAAAINRNPHLVDIEGRGWRVIDLGRKTPGRIESVHVKDAQQEQTDTLAIDNALSTLSMMENSCTTGLFAPLGRGTWKCSMAYCEFFNRCEYGSRSQTTVPMGAF